MSSRLRQPRRRRRIRHGCKCEAGCLGWFARVEGKRGAGPLRPGAGAGPIRESVAMAAHIGGPLAGDANSAFVDGIHLALLVPAATVALTAAVVAVLLRGRALCNDLRDPTATR